MPEPTSTAVATLVAVGASVPVLTAFGVPLGLRADVLLAGLLGALSAIALLNTVPSTGDTWRELLRTTGKRFFVAAASCFTAGYLVPALVSDAATIATLLGMSFIAGAGAQQLVAAMVTWLVKKVAAP